MNCAKSNTVAYLQHIIVAPRVEVVLNGFCRKYAFQNDAWIFSVSLMIRNAFALTHPWFNAERIVNVPISQLTNVRILAKVTHLLGERWTCFFQMNWPPKVYPKNSQANGLAGNYCARLIAINISGERSPSMRRGTTEGASSLRYQGQIGISHCTQFAWRCVFDDPI